MWGYVISMVAGFWIGISGLLYLAFYWIEEKWDLPMEAARTPIESASSAHSRLQLLVQRVIEEALHLPAFLDYSGLPRDSKGRLPEFNPTTYEDLLATAILNKVIDRYQQQGASSSGVHSGSSSPEVAEGAREGRRRRPRAAPRDSSAERSSLEPASQDDYPHSDSSGRATDGPTKQKHYLISASSTDDDEPYTKSYSNPVDGALANINFQNKTRVAFPEYGGDIVELNGNDERNLEDDSLEANGNLMQNTEIYANNNSWEENWLFQKKRIKNAPSVPVPMLIPNSNTEYRALIGDRDAEDTTDLSEAGSEAEDKMEDTADIKKVLVDSKTIIGGKNPDIVLALMNQDANGKELITSSLVDTEAKLELSVAVAVAELEILPQEEIITERYEENDEIVNTFFEETNLCSLDTTDGTLIKEVIQELKIETFEGKLIDIDSNDKKKYTKISTPEAQSIESIAIKKVTAPIDDLNNDLQNKSLSCDQIVSSVDSDMSPVDSFIKDASISEEKYNDDVNYVKKENIKDNINESKLVEVVDDTLNKSNSITQENVILIETEPLATMTTKETITTAVCTLELNNNDLTCELKKQENACTETEERPEICNNESKVTNSESTNTICEEPQICTDTTSANSKKTQDIENHIYQDDDGQIITLIESSETRIFDNYSPAPDKIQMEISNINNTTISQTSVPTERQLPKQNFKNFLKSLESDDGIVEYRQTLMKSQSIMEENVFSLYDATNYDIIVKKDDDNEDSLDGHQQESEYIETIARPVQRHMDSLKRQHNVPTPNDIVELNLTDKLPPPLPISCLPDKKETITEEEVIIPLLPVTTACSENIDENDAIEFVMNGKRYTPERCQEQATEAPQNNVLIDITETDTPGSIAEREHKKWLNAVPMENNPYSPEAIQRRLSKQNQKSFFDIISRPNTATVKESESTPKGVSLQNALAERKSDFIRYGRDYYINEAKKAAGARKRFTAEKSKSEPDSTESSKSVLNRSFSEAPISSKNFKTISQMSINESSRNIKSEEIHLPSQSEIYSATPVIVENTDEQFDDLYKNSFKQEQNDDFKLNSKIDNKLFNLSNGSTETNSDILDQSDSISSADDFPRVYNIQSGKITTKNDYLQINDDEDNKQETNHSILPKTNGKIEADNNQTVIGNNIKSWKSTGDVYLEAKEKENSHTPESKIEADIELPSVKDLAKKFYPSTNNLNENLLIKPKRKLSKDILEKNVSKTFSSSQTSLKQPQHMHSLTARSISKEFREELKLSMPIQTNMHPGGSKNIPAGADEPIKEGKSSRPESPVPEPGSLRNKLAFFEQLNKH